MIALFHGAPAYGAVERYVVAVAGGLKARNERALLLYPDVPELEPFAALAGGSLRVETFPAELLTGPAQRLVAATARRLRRERPRIVHVTDVWAPALVAGRLARPARLLVTHHTPELPRRDSLAGRVWWRLGWLARPEVVYTSQSDRARDGRALLRTHVVPLGIDLDRFVFRPQRPRGDTPVIGNVARLAPQKGHDVLVAAAALVLERHPRARFVIVGDGELRATLEEQARRAGLEEQVSFLGARADVPALLASFDVFAFPSRFEGLCLAVIEAQAVGVPVVATPVGGIQETVVPGETGLLSRIDDARSLADGILALLDDPVRAARMAVEARHRVEASYSEQRMVEETLALYGVGPAAAAR